MTLKTRTKAFAKEKLLAWRMGMSPPQATYAGAAAVLRGALQRGPTPLKILVVGDGQSYTSDQQFAPISRHRAALRQRFGHVFRFRLLKDVWRELDPLAGHDAVFLKFTFRKTPEQASEIAATFRRWSDLHQIPFVYFDGDDDLCVQFPCVVDACDVYLKKHLFADRSAYARTYEGRCNLTEHAVRTHGIDCSGDLVPRSAALTPGQISKLQLGWNIGLDDKIARLAGSILRLKQHVERDVDIVCRASSGPAGTLIHAMRQPAVEAMQRLDGPYRVLAPTVPVSQRIYYSEMLRSKMCVAPFGYGEECWRDFEAVLCGCLLLKPDMGHVQTAPDIFRPYETYVPLAWDFSDLEEKVEYFVRNPQELARIAGNARQVLTDALSEDWFIERYRNAVLPAVQKPLPADTGFPVEA